MNEPYDSKEINTEGMRSLVSMLGVLFTALRLVIIVVLVCLVFGGMFYVQSHEEAMLFHFGKLTVRDGQEVLKSGQLYWAFPYPVDAVKRVPAQKSITITSNQFWPKIDANRLQELQGQAPPPSGGPGSGLRPGEDGYLLTGDANIMHMVWTLTYRVVDPKKYYLNFFEDPANADGSAKTAKEARGVESLIESVLADAVLNEVGTWNVEDVFRRYGAAGAVAGDAPVKQESLSTFVRQRVIERLTKTELDVGIEVQQVSLVEVQPPVSTQQAFKEVFASATDYRAEIDRAVAYEKKVVTEAEGKASQTISEARAYQTRVVESVKASKGYFEKVLAEYEKNPKTMLVSLHADAMRDVLAKADSRYVVHSAPNGRQEVRLMLGPEPEKPRSAGPAQPGAPPDNH